MSENARNLPVVPTRNSPGPLGGASNPASSDADSPGDAPLSPRQRELKQRVIAALRTIFDPEIPVNIYDLGLIYSIDITESGQARLTMTLTAPGCPVAATFPGQVRRAIEAVEGITEAAVELVWEPPWTKDRMSEDALLQLGLLW